MADTIVTAKGSAPASPSAIRRAQSGGKIPKDIDDNVVREQQSKGKVRPDGPGDSTAPIKPEPRSPGPAIRGLKPTSARARRAPARAPAPLPRRK